MAVLAVVILCCVCRYVPDVLVASPHIPHISEVIAET